MVANRKKLQPAIEQAIVYINDKSGWTEEDTKRDHSPCCDKTCMDGCAGEAVRENAAGSSWKAFGNDFMKNNSGLDVVSCQEQQLIICFAPPTQQD
eukprot:745886-Hanusia_phi.AAC.8